MQVLISGEQWEHCCYIYREVSCILRNLKIQDELTKLNYIKENRYSWKVLVPFKMSRGRGAMAGTVNGASNCEARPGAIRSHTYQEELHIGIFKCQITLL